MWLFRLPWNVAHRCAHLALDRFWDVLHHEYGHYVSFHYNTAKSPGGDHATSTNLSEDPQGAGGTIHGKDHGTRLAWGEAWPTYYGTSLQQDMGSSALGVPNVGDPTYSDTEDYNPPLVDDLEPKAGSKGEDNELAIMRTLWDLYDSANDDRDEVALGGQGVWDKLVNKDYLRMSAVWPGITSGLTMQEKLQYAEIFADHKIAPDPTDPADEALLPPNGGGTTFKWDKNVAGPTYTGDKFVVEFWDADFTTLLHKSAELNTNEYTPTEQVFEDEIFKNEKLVKWIVYGSNTANPETGPYLSPARSIRTQGAAIAYILDRSGSMGGAPIVNAKLAAQQGITAMKEGDEVAVISFSTSSSVNYPLTLITDNAVRQAASGAVGGLFASGSTCIGCGLLDAYNELIASGADPRDYVLLTDGFENVSPRVADVIHLFQNLNAQPEVAAACEAMRAAGVTIDFVGRDDRLTHLEVLPARTARTCPWPDWAVMLTSIGLVGAFSRCDTVAASPLTVITSGSTVTDVIR